MNFNMNRDQYGIISQLNYDGVTLDSGDSAFSTGLMAGCGSLKDAMLMPLFVQTGQLVRHPYSTDNTGTAPHNNPRATSRDQVLAFFFGAHAANNDQVYAACLQYAQGWRVNADVLMPHHKLYLYKCAKVEVPKWLQVIGEACLTLNILWNTKVKPEEEQNQLVVISIMMGRQWAAKVYVKHPNIFKNLNDYFCGWRKRCEIATALKEKLIEVLTK